jgi:hypothetical protein
MNLRMKNQSSKSYSLGMIASVALVAVLLLIATLYALAVQFPISPDELSMFAFPP